jgi:HD superfamily phosphodiesterase
MKKLTKRIAKKIAEKYLVKNNIDPFHFIHTQKVVEAVKIISKGKKLDKEILEICAWIHDIGYSVNNLPNNDPDHSANSINLLDKEGYEVTDKIKDCVLNHGSKGNPKTQEGKILQIAVKFNIIDKDFLEYIIDNKAKGKEVKFLKKRTDSAVKMLKRLKSMKI